MTVVRNAVAGLGFDQDAAIVPFPVDLFLVGSDLGPLQARMDQFVDALTSWEPRAKETGIQAPGRMTIEAADHEAALDKMNSQFLINYWGDGLPLKAPTIERVNWILRGTERPRDELIGRVLPQAHLASVETVAVALAMAGGRPEYLPVLIAAVEAILDPGMNHSHYQATSASNFPVVIVNGQIARDIRLNSGFGLLGPDPQHPAGASIGRALRLILQNVGGALPGVGSMAMFGAMRFTNAVFAEDEEGLPPAWNPVCTDHLGLKPGSNAVTVYFASGASNVMRRGIGKEEANEEALQGLQRVAGYLQVPNVHYRSGWSKGTPGALLMSRVVARQLADLGWTQETIKRLLWEESHQSTETLRATGAMQWIQEEPGEQSDLVAETGKWPITKSPEQIILCVAGGGHPTHNFWMQATAPKIGGGEIPLPADWDQLLREAENELGCYEDTCLVGGGGASH